jgi:hypothetical protein
MPKGMKFEDSAILGYFDVEFIEREKQSAAQLRSSRQLFSLA